MTPEERLAAGFEAMRLVRARLEAHLGAREDWTDEMVRAEIARRFLRGTG